MDFNLYRLVFNAPTVYVDPFGLDHDIPIPDAVAVPLPGPLLPVQNNLLPHISRRWQHLVQECDLIFDGESWQAVGGRGLLLGVKANVNAIATTARSLVTLGIWAEPWEVWAVDDADRPFYEGGFLAARFGWESLPTAGIGKLTQAPGQMGRWGRYALYWDAGQNVVQVGRGSCDIYENGLTWGNGLQVGGGLLGLGGNYSTWRRLIGVAPVGRGPNSRPMFAEDWEVLLSQRYGAANVQRVPQFRTVDDILENPAVLTGRTPAEVEARIGSTPGWRVERLRRGAHAGQGWVLREYGPNGLPTGRMIRWHPGGGHHGPNPYWRVIDHNGDIGGIIPGGRT